MKRILLALGLAAALCSLASARSTLECNGGGCWNPTTFSPPLGTINLAQLAPPALCWPEGALGNRGDLPLCPLTVSAQPGAIVAPAPVVIDTGTIAGQALTWVITVGGGALSIVVTGLLVRLFQHMGVQITDAARARLQDIILNGLNLATKDAAAQLAGRGQVVIKQQAVANAVKYVQAHGADTIKQLGLDPTSPAAVEAIKARIETAIADPAVPTPKALDAPAPGEAAAPVGAAAALASRAGGPAPKTAS